MATRAEWSQRIAEWRASGEGREAFAAKRGLNPKLLQWWVTQFARESRKRAKAPSGVLFARVTAARSSVAKPAPAVPPTGSAALEIVLPRGCAVRVSSGFDARLLSAVVDALVAEVR